MKDVSTGLVVDIQRFSIHDGPGIRTNIFVKGCQLSCKWCCNPEMISPFPEIMVYNLKCIRCNKCVDACESRAITIDGQRGIILDRPKCNLCLACTQVCPSRAIVRVGNQVSLNQLMAEIESDKLFYEDSGGGVTVTGGDPLLQHEFVSNLLAACKGKGFDTAVEINGHAEWTIIDRLFEYVDLALFDLKCMSNDRHREATGVGNELILDNARRLASGGARMWIRLPLVHGYNDSLDNLQKTGEFAATLKAEKVSILPYHEWGRDKYEKLGKPYPLDGQNCFLKEESVKQAKVVLENFGLKVTVGY